MSFIYGRKWLRNEKLLKIKVAEEKRMNELNS